MMCFGSYYERAYYSDQLALILYNNRRLELLQHKPVAITVTQLKRAVFLATNHLNGITKQWFGQEEKYQTVKAHLESMLVGFSNEDYIELKTLQKLMTKKTCESTSLLDVIKTGRWGEASFQVRSYQQFIAQLDRISQYFGTVLHQELTSQTPYGHVQPPPSVIHQHRPNGY